MSESGREVFIGIDVSKEKLDVAVRPTGEFMSFSNNEDGMSCVVDFVKAFSPIWLFWKQRGIGNSGSGSIGRQRFACCCHQSKTGKRLCQSHR